MSDETVRVTCPGCTGCIPVPVGTYVFCAHCGKGVGYAQPDGTARPPAPGEVPPEIQALCDRAAAAAREARLTAMLGLSCPACHSPCAAPPAADEERAAFVLCPSCKALLLLTPQRLFVEVPEEAVPAELRSQLTAARARLSRRPAS